ncbi:MAG: GrpB family protein [Candidatus Protochlamydia sp.]|nr:GrpB family protein [Candidatus Protochlamydia sp.]
MTANKSSKHIVVLPYIPDWPKTFEVESQKIKNVLGDNCIAVHHVGSTSFRMC